MSSRYVYWDIDTTNWNTIHTIYKPLFSKLNIQDSRDVQTAYSYFKEITKDLIDGHYTLSFGIPGLQSANIDPCRQRKILSGTFHSPYNYLQVDSNYLDRQFVCGDYTTIDHSRLRVISGLIKKHILYFSCNIFALKELSNSGSSGPAGSALNYFFSTLPDSAGTLKGIIIDLRNNQGGNVEDLNFLLGKMIAKPMLIGYTRYKNGPERLNFTPWIPVVLEPQLGSQSLQKPVIVLLDNFTISLGEIIAMAIHSLPNARLVGERSWGATGPISSGDFYDDGSFTIPSILNVYTSSAEFKYIDGNIYESKGFPPDISISDNDSSLRSGHDLMLEKAVTVLNRW